MGYICHNAIIVTGYGDQAEKAWQHAQALVAKQAEHMGGVSTNVMSPLSPEVTNGYRSFAIWPDGSKEGWETSDAGDDLRDALVAYLDDGDVWVEWCEVRFGDEADMNGMLRCSGEPPTNVTAHSGSTGVDS